MFFIGIDVAKDKHDCCVLSGDGEYFSFTFANSREGFNGFLAKLAELCGEDKTKVGLESTGHYSANLLSFLESHGFEVIVFNPLSVSRQRTASSLRRTKTDKNDSRYIAQMLMSAEDKPHQTLSYHTETLKSLTRARFRLVKEIQPLKNRYRRLVHIVFPELQGFFCKLDIPTVTGLLQKLPSAKDIAGCNILTLKNILSEASHGRLKRGKAEELKALAKMSIGTYNLGDAVELKLMAQRIEFMETQKAQFDKEINTVMAELNSPITSIPGIGTTLGAVILAEIGDRTFETPAKLLAFAGCEPSTYQSGNYTATRMPMVKHGSRYLRCALFQAARAARMHSPSFAAYIARKKAQGKHDYVALSHAMKKLTRVIFAVLTKNTLYTEPII